MQGHNNLLLLRPILFMLHYDLLIYCVQIRNTSVFNEFYIVDSLIIIKKLFVDLIDCYQYNRKCTDLSSRQVPDKGKMCYEGFLKSNRKSKLE